MRAMVLLLAAVLALAGCAADAPTERGSDTATDAPMNAPSDAGDAAVVEPRGNVVEVQMITDENGNYFEPAEVTARRGDVVRFVLVSGVHNVTFPAADNPSDPDLPEEMGPMLQLPGQTYDITVDFGPGKYRFQCDPHVPLGMLGTLAVEN